MSFISLVENSFHETSILSFFSKLKGEGDTTLSIKCVEEDKMEGPWISNWVSGLRQRAQSKLREQCAWRRETASLNFKQFIRGEAHYAREHDKYAYRIILLQDMVGSTGLHMPLIMLATVPTVLSAYKTLLR